MKKAQLTKVIDHTNLRPDATEADVLKLCKEAVDFGFYSVCVNPYWVSKAKFALRGQIIRICAVAGFPLGASKTAVKAKEAEEIVRDGGTEVDMVVNIGRLKEGNYKAVESDIAAVRAAIGTNITLKVIIEAALLSQEQKKEAARLVVSTGADFVKTSTGFNAAGGATANDVALLRSVVGTRAKVKAAGGIRNLQAAMDMLNAGADRIGTSASVAIIEELEALAERGEALASKTTSPQI
jgi:deoxyribose-phosphate aldolase